MTDDGTRTVLAWDIFLPDQKIKIRKLLEIVLDLLDLTKGSFSGLSINFFHYILIIILKSLPKAGLFAIFCTCDG